MNASRGNRRVTEDPTLERLYDYTKFHIGVYLVAAGSMVTIAGSEELGTFLGKLTNDPVWLWLAIAAMALAGVAGGIIASSCTAADEFGDVWEKGIGPWFAPELMCGRRWAALEHTAFWFSLGFFAVAALT